MRNKLFFFGDYQRTLDNFGYVVRAIVPTIGHAQRRLQRGARSKSTIRLPGDVDGNNRVAFAGNSIPANRISPIAQKLIGVHPGAEHRRRAARPEQLPEGADAREDDRRLRREVQLHASAKDQLSYRVQLHAAGRVRSGPVRRVRRAGQRRLRRDRHEHELSTAATWTRAFSSSTVLDVRGGLNYYHNVDDAGRRRAHDAATTSASRARTSTTSRAACRRSASAATTQSGAGVLGRACRGIAPRRPGTSRRR